MSRSPPCARARVISIRACDLLLTYCVGRRNTLNGFRTTAAGARKHLESTFKIMVLIVLPQSGIL